MKVISAPGGTFSPLMLDFAIILSELKVKAECENPANDIVRAPVRRRRRARGGLA